MKEHFDFTKIIPSSVKVEYLTGDTAFKAQQVAAFTGIHPVILEMGRTLTEEVGKVARFRLANEDMKKHAEELLEEFLKGLRRVAKVLSKEESLGAKGGRDGDALVFWMAKKKPWPARKKGGLN